jgi:hypothetical protein
MHAQQAVPLSHRRYSTRRVVEVVLVALGGVVLGGVAGATIGATVGGNWFPTFEHGGAVGYEATATIGLQAGATLSGVGAAALAIHRTRRDAPHGGITLRRALVVAAVSGGSAVLGGVLGAGLGWVIGRLWLPALTPNGTPGEQATAGIGIGVGALLLAVAGTAIAVRRTGPGAPSRVRSSGR